MAQESDTLGYYRDNADEFIAGTVDLDLSDLHDRFLAKVPAGGLILDAGCGSGRDAKAFLDRGFRVRAFDAVPELAERAGALLGQPVSVMRFKDVAELDAYDGVWACASLLHVPEADLPDRIARLWAALKPRGIFYLSFKHGEGERFLQGRRFTDATEDRLRAWCASLPDIDDLTCWTTEDRRPERTSTWINALLQRRSAPSAKLVTGETSNPFLPQLSAAMAQALEIDFAVAFVKTTGLRLLLDDLHTAIGGCAEQTRLPARLRVVTSDYLGITDPDALRLLLLLQQKGAQVRIFEASSASFHLKAYLFARLDANGGLVGTAFIGSSNISRSALTDGLEWNYRIEFPGDRGFVEARARFEELFHDPRTKILDDAWIDLYESRRKPPSVEFDAGSNEQEPPPEPNEVQIEALAALKATREAGYKRGLVVMATGLGKTWLAAFDANAIAARRILFVAHREEILTQAAETFLRIRPNSRVGFYTGRNRDRSVDILCASVQTLGRASHLMQFPGDHFDYVVVDEFHHAAAPTYRQLLAHFHPTFLLGLTATPDRTDQSDILSFCDDNLVFSRNLFAGVTAGLLAPFHYYGIWDETVDYRAIPWRNGRFDPEQLTNKLATLARARHALRQWRERKQKRTLAFCVSIKHAEFMANQFYQAGVRAIAVYAGSATGRTEALEQLRNGRIDVIFSVDLFSEGVDLPEIDTVMMLRPTESKILFQQQLGRGLRKAPDKDHLVVLDFIGNHHSFLHKSQVLADVGPTHKALAAVALALEAGTLALPPGCYINYDLQLIAFLKQLDQGGLQQDYENLRQTLGRRPTLAEFYRTGASISAMRQQYGHWFAFVDQMKDLSDHEAPIARAQAKFLSELETTSLVKSFKLVLIEAFQELDGWRAPPSVEALCKRSWEVLHRRRRLLPDLPEEPFDTSDGTSNAWRAYWRRNPINAWIGGNRPGSTDRYFQLTEEGFAAAFKVEPDNSALFADLVQEIVDYRFLTYEARQSTAQGADNVVTLQTRQRSRIELPYFPNLPIACGHFKTGYADVAEHVGVGQSHGRLDPARHFVARASGNSMDGGRYPIHDGDYLLLELVSPISAGSITGKIMAIERQDETGDNQYLLRVVTKSADGRYILKANNPDYADLPASADFRTFARLRSVLDPFEVAIGKAFLREAIPPLFGEAFNPGIWNVGHVVLKKQKAHILLVTLNKQGKAEDHRYIDRWGDAETFHWQTQNSTTSASSRGQQIINQEKLGLAIHLFVRDHKLADGKGAPFIYHGRVRYDGHTGEAPMNVTFKLLD